MLDSSLLLAAVALIAVLLQFTRGVGAWAEQTTHLVAAIALAMLAVGFAQAGLIRGP